MSKILIVEDDPEIAMLERDYLEIEGFETQVTDNGQMAITQAVTGDYDLILLDLMLPGCSGYDVCRVIRDKIDVPILMVTARTESVDKIRGLGLGADDYVAKPFDPAELVARVKTQLRRYTTYNVAAESRKQIYDFAGLYICRDNRKCSLYGRELALTPLEFDILWYLCEHKGTVVSSEVLFEAVWGEKYLDNNNTVMAHIARLREKMGEPSRKPRFIKTVWGVGYTIE